ncbi:hypothetical protein SDC9_68106 [bioreactor metagenome]|uniref:SLH domain-containing protein n=1 Tax=bioreactor metagenome TaxID=1076179 RepID=A0A644Y182_9ZZZZ
MKKFLSLLMATALVMAFATAAGASDYDAMADDLAAIGMFTGTDVGYELDREPTRAEVAVMLVRMLGAEETAKTQYAANTISHPFTDVADWAAPYVAYLYTNKLSNGVSDTEYGSSQLCSGQMYCTFMLRALGYSDADGGDFSYAAALDYAAEKGITDKAFVATFKRDELVAVSYQTLSTAVKGGSQSLLEKLTAAGAIDETKAAAIESKLAILKEYETLALKDVASYKSLDCSGTMSFSATVGGQSISVSDMKMDMKMNLTDTAVDAAIHVNMTDPTTGQPVEIYEWMKDGWLYMKQGDLCYKMQMDYGQMLATIQQSAGMASGTMSSSMSAYMFTDVTKTETDEGTLYEFKMSPKFFNSMLGSILGNAGLTNGSNINFGSMVESILVKDGAVKNIKVSADLSVALEGMGEMAMQINADLTINSIGSTVVIEYPDFSNYVEMPTAPATGA